MVQTFQTTASNDLYVNSSGSMVVLTGQQAVAAACETATQTQLGECVLQTGLGLPNFGVIWVGSPDYALWQSYLEQTLLNVPGVVSVSNIVLTAENSVLTYSAQVTSIYDPQPLLIQGTISSPS